MAQAVHPEVKPEKKTSKSGKNVKENGVKPKPLLLAQASTTTTSNGSAKQLAEWPAYPMRFNREMSGKTAVMPRDTECILARMNHNENHSGCVGYTNHPIRPGTTWRITLLDTNNIDYPGQESGLRVGLTTSLPEEVPLTLPLKKDGKNFYYEIKLSEKKDVDEDQDPECMSMALNDSLDFLLTNNGELEVYSNGKYLKTLATELPMDGRLWGGVDVLGKCIEIKSEQIVPPEVVEVSSLDKPGNVWAENMKVSVKIGPGIFEEDENPLKLSFSAHTTKGCVFPPDFVSRSPVYRISSSRAIKEGVEVEISAEHNLKVKTDQEAKEIIFCMADEDKNMLRFCKVPGATFKAGEEHGTLKTTKFGYINIGTTRSSKIVNCYKAACCYSYTHNEVHMAVALSLANEVYTMNFKTAMEEEWRSTPTYRCCRVSFKGPVASLNYPSLLNNWRIDAQLYLKFKREYIDECPDDLSMSYDYPPRLHLCAKAEKNAEDCNARLFVTGLNEAIDFLVPLRCNFIKLKPTNKPTMIQLLSLDDNSINVVQETATEYYNIGTFLLKDKTGSEVNIISHGERDPRNIIRNIYIRWLQQDEDASWEKLCTCFRTHHLNNLAARIEGYFGIPSPRSKPAKVPTLSLHAPTAKRNIQPLLLTSEPETKPLHTPPKESKSKPHTPPKEPETKPHTPPKEPETRSSTATPKVLDLDDKLTPDDAGDILDEILPAQGKSYQFGLKLRLPHHIVKAIHSKDSSREDYLLEILIAFLEVKGKLKPTWRVILDALKSPSVGLATLANELEEAHFPSRETVPETVVQADAEGDEIRAEEKSTPCTTSEILQTEHNESSVINNSRVSESRSHTSTPEATVVSESRSSTPTPEAPKSSSLASSFEEIEPSDVPPAPKLPPANDIIRVGQPAAGLSGLLRRCNVL